MAGTTVRNAVIANGTSLSGTVTIPAGRRLRGIMMPAGWDAADITFQASVDGTTFGNVFNEATEVTVTGPAAGRFMLISAEILEGMPFIKVRSGLSGAAVNQTADRTLKLVCASD